MKLVRTLLTALLVTMGSERKGLDHEDSVLMESTLVEVVPGREEKNVLVVEGASKRDDDLEDLDAGNFDKFDDLTVGPTRKLDIDPKVDNLITYLEGLRSESWCSLAESTSAIYSR